MPLSKQNTFGNKEISSLQLLVIGKTHNGYDCFGIGSLHGDGIILYLDCDNDCAYLASGDSKHILNHCQLPDFGSVQSL